MTAEDCSTCPMCSLVAWLDDRLDEKVEEMERCIEEDIPYTNHYEFSIPKSTWIKNRFTKQRMYDLPLLLKRNKVRDIAVFYCKAHNHWVIALELSFF